MFKNVLFWIVLFCFSGLQAQETDSAYSTKKTAFTTDTIHLETGSINSYSFKVLNSKNQAVDSTLYQVNFAKGTFVFRDKSQPITDSVTIHYLKLPDLLTKEYSIYDSSKIIDNDATNQNLYKIENPEIKKATPFDGLVTKGSLSRGVTVGNNQNAVVNSNLDFQITGKISDKVSIRASIQDTNIPVQEGSYSQKLNQYDNIFMELFSDSWNVRAGDVFIGNTTTNFLNFNKKIQGLSTTVNLENEDSKTNLFSSGGLVTGHYASSNFKGQEGNQGPYKLIGQNGELYVLVIIGSERVYVNGVLLKRGETNDYVIDYNSGEIVFTPLFSITSEMRIVIEYQYSEINYTRFVTYDGGSFTTKKWNFGAALYSENDLKNQPVQQNLSKEQVQILAKAGDNSNLMIAPSAYLDTYDEKKILYKKTILEAESIFEYSTNPNDVLYTVTFTFIGLKKGNYILKNAASIDKIFEYVAQINGIPQGNYAPIIQLIAPIKEQVATFFGKYNPSKKTAVDFEIAISNSDKNLFSTLDDSNNKGLAGEINTKQRLYSKKWNLDAFANLQVIEANFKPVERINSIEFYRDWNLNNSITGNQNLLSTGLNFDLKPNKNSKNLGSITYAFQRLAIANNYSGIKNNINAGFAINNWIIKSDGSLLKSDDIETTTEFARNVSQVQYNFRKNWVGGTLRFEDNQGKSKITQQLSLQSQRFNEYGIYTGHGDSTRVYVQLGYLRRTNDSIQNGLLQRVNTSNTYNFKSQLFKTEIRELSVFANYRILEYTDPALEKTPSLNSRILYSDQFFKQLVQSSTLYETNSGTMPFQNYTYVEVPSGQGKYTWNDYNNNGIKELEEFEIAPFIDLATYTRIFLPNQIYFKTNQNKFSQSFIINPNIWQNSTSFKKVLSYFYLQSSFIIDRKIKNDGDHFELNPFHSASENVLGLLSTLTNSLFYNRGKRDNSITYTYMTNQAQNLLSVGTIKNKNNFHQLQYQHLLQKSWLFDALAKTILTKSESETFAEKNYTIEGYVLAPKISYLFSKNISLDLFYEYINKENQIGSLDTLLQSRFGTAFSYNGNSKFTANGEVSLYKNDFKGNPFSSAGYQMLEGLQTGQNLTWRTLLQMNLTTFLDLNFIYQGRKSETSDAIHTGSVALRAYF
jgi:hypothetical protein